MTTDPAIIDRLTPEGAKRPKAAIGVEVEQVFIHCSQAFVRSQLWEPSSWTSDVDRDAVMGMLREHLADNDAADVLD